MDNNLTYSKYSFLPSLGVKEHNFGCFLNDQWVGNGEVITSYNPNDNRVL